MLKRQRIFITGRVQGVGFRPAIHHIADKLGLSGTVYNDARGVTVELQGEEARIGEFLTRLQSTEKPPLAEIEACRTEDIAVIEGEHRFTIGRSDSAGTALAQVTADMAVCQDCLREMSDKKDFRYHYPFINCTNCGPRYSIVKTIPYDRPNTTMSAFEMCNKCTAQYADVTDRRFHAQPVACGMCGPRIWLTDSKGTAIKEENDEAIKETAHLLRHGKIVAIKGIGGFHLAVDALNDDAVRILRERKRRDNKPFAMMADSVEKIRKYSVVSEQAERILRSPQSPIVLLPKKRGAKIAATVAEDVNTFGFMLCYVPLHHLLFAQGIDVLVMTSGNISDEPLICENDQALARLGDVADAFLMHDRQIYRQVDDSVVHFIDTKAVPLRRARGYVPTPILMAESSKRDIFAAGSDLKNTFCFVKEDQLICSEHIGDLVDAEVYHHYIDSVEHLRRLFEVEPTVIACDLHPSYLSTQYALSLPAERVIQIQHHWAHIASVLVENNLSGPIIGIECDGTGYGTDGAIWGCECMIATMEHFERFGHLQYYPLAGGDKATKEAIRPALGLIRQTCGPHFDIEQFRWLLEPIQTDTKKQDLILQQLERNVNTVDTSSLGRVFDAVAAMAGLGACNNFEAQLPMALEAQIDGEIEKSYDFDLHRSEGEPLILDLRKTIQQLIKDIADKTDRGVISAKFHNCIAAALLEMATEARKSTGLDTVALGGGVFCNRYLTNRLIRLLKKNDFVVLFNVEVPANDGGISLGQAAIAASLVKRTL